MKTVVFVACATLLFAAMCSVASNTVPVAIDPVATLHPGDGSPTPTCIPGKPCNEADQLRKSAPPLMIAGDGSPTPLCIPGKPCNEADQLRKSAGPLMIAGDGSPTPLCIPGKPCNEADQFGKTAEPQTMDSANLTIPGLMRPAA